MPFRIERNDARWAEYDDYCDAHYALEGLVLKWPFDKWALAVYGARDNAEMSVWTWRHRMKTAGDPAEKARCEREWLQWKDRLKEAEKAHGKS